MHKNWDIRAKVELKGLQEGARIDILKDIEETEGVVEQTAVATGKPVKELQIDEIDVWQHREPVCELQQQNRQDKKRHLTLQELSP